MRILTFKSKNELEGALIIIQTVIRQSGLTKSFSETIDGLSVTFENVPDLVFQIAESNADYPIKGLFGLQRKMKEALNRVNDEWDTAPNKLGLAKSVIAELESDLAEAKAMIAQIEGQ